MTTPESEWLTVVLLPLSPPPVAGPSGSAAARRRPDAATLRRLYVDEGLTATTVAQRLGVSTSAAHNWLRAAGVAMRPSPAKTVPVDDDTVRRLYLDEGRSAVEIAAQVACSVTSVFFRLRRVSVPRRPARPSWRPWAEPCRKSRMSAIHASSSVGNSPLENRLLW